jgi:DNA-binding NarL/FixJ family response regulator
VTRTDPRGGVCQVCGGKCRSGSHRCTACYRQQARKQPWNPEARNRWLDEQREDTARLTRAGWTAQRIAWHLRVSVRTVERYRRQARILAAKAA